MAELFNDIFTLHKKLAFSVLKSIVASISHSNKSSVYGMKIQSTFYSFDRQSMRRVSKSKNEIVKVGSSFCRRQTNGRTDTESIDCG